ncbi:MAG: hypothetical protein K0A93_13550 [Desulfuromonadaceae bacterium]|nr:hypothetical protein [Desulfuromonadaceae bacterium]
MPRGEQASFLKKLLRVMLASGIAAGLAFPFLVTPLLGTQVLTLPFFVSCIFMGLVMGVVLYLIVRGAMLKQLRHHFKLLEPLIGNRSVDHNDLEGLQAALEASIHQVEDLFNNLLNTVDLFVPHYKSLAESSRNLSERASEGLAAALATRKNVESMETKQAEIVTRTENLSQHTQDESAISGELSASLDEMSQAMDHATGKFIETTSSVDELAASILEVAAQADEIARSVENTTRDLDEIGESLLKIRNGAAESATVVGTVKVDAENGLQVVESSINEMERIERESVKSTEAMHRLSRQTGEVAKIIEVIKELVSDTELLAFNAAIIAAKAGEEGKGFSVVAEEIRDLADRTTNSAQDIQRIVKAINTDTDEVLAAVEATGKRIAKGKELSLSAGEALFKIVESSQRAALTSDEISEVTEQQGVRSQSLLEDATQSLRSVKEIARVMQEQQRAVVRIQDSVNQIKSANDQVSRGMEEQVKATRQFDQGLAAREEQINAIRDIITFQSNLSNKVFTHFESSERRLHGNAELAKIINQEIYELEILAERLRQIVDDVSQTTAGDQPLPPPTAPPAQHTATAMAAAKG